MTDPFRWNGLRPVTPTRDVHGYLIREGDLVIPLRAARPTVWVARHVPPGVIAGGSLALGTVLGDGVIPEYLAWHLNHPVTGLALDRMTQGSNLKFIPLAALRAVEITVPPLTVQDRIATAAGLHARAAALERALADARAALVNALTLDALRRQGAGDA